MCKHDDTLNIVIILNGKLKILVNLHKNKKQNFAIFIRKI